MRSLEINSDYDLTITNMVLDIYDYFDKDHNNENEEINCPKGFKHMMEIINNRVYNNANIFKETGVNIGRTELPDTKTIVIGYSSGVDSTFQALRFRHEGYHVILLHCDNLNKSYPDEKNTAREFASKYGFDLVTVGIKHNGSQFFIDNPTKNQCVIMACMIDYCRANGINNIALGSSASANFNNRHTQLSITDAHETYDTFLEGINEYVGNIRYHHIDRSKKDCYKFIIENYPDALKLVNSCVSPYRFKKHLNKVQREKFGLEPITDNRCMSCFKCITEYLMLVDLGYMERNEAYIDHSCKYMKKKRDNITTVGLIDKNSTNEEIERNIING